MWKLIQYAFIFLSFVTGCEMAEMTSEVVMKCLKRCGLDTSASSYWSTH